MGPDVQQPIQQPEKPKIKIGRWAMWLGLVGFVTGPLQAILVNLIRPGNSTGQTATAINIAPLSLIVSVVALVVGIGAHKRGERSRILWIGLSLAVITIVYFSYIWISELVG